jgi:hypothetical protein
MVDEVSIFYSLALENSPARHSFDVMPSRGGAHLSRAGCLANAGYENSRVLLMCNSGGWD